MTTQQTNPAPPFQPVHTPAPVFSSQELASWQVTTYESAVSAFRLQQGQPVALAGREGTSQSELSAGPMARAILSMTSLVRAVGKPFFLLICCIFLVTLLEGCFLRESAVSTAALRTASHRPDGTVFASSMTVPLLKYPEGLTSWQGKVYVATLNVTTTTENRIFVFDSAGHLLHAIGALPGQQLVASGGINGLTIDRRTGDLFVAANITGKILRIQNPDSDHPVISVYATYPKGGGPEDMAFNQFGVLYASDSNLGVVYEIPPGGGTPKLLIGPPGSGAPISDEGLFESPIMGISPNGVVFSPDYRRFYVANTWASLVVAFDVDQEGQVTGHARIFAQHFNFDLEEYPTDYPGFDIPGVTRIGKQGRPGTPLHGPDGLALDVKGDVWVASNLGDNITELSPTGQILRTCGQSAVTAQGLLNQPASLTFVGNTIYATQMGIFTGLAGNPKLPFRVVSFDVDVSGAGGNGNY